MNCRLTYFSNSPRKNRERLIATQTEFSETVVSIECHESSTAAASNSSLLLFPLLYVPVFRVENGLNFSSKLWCNKEYSQRLKLLINPPY